MVPLILIVEDHFDTAELYREYLEYHGLRVLVARNGVDGVAMAAAHAPDVIVMDLALPLLDGLTAIRQVRASERRARRRTAIIAVSGGTTHHTPEAAVAAGADQFLIKPCLPGDLLEVIRRIVPRAVG